jgi:hypothetical protein
MVNGLRYTLLIYHIRYLNPQVLQFKVIHPPLSSVYAVYMYNEELYRSVVEVGVLGSLFCW